MYACPRCKVVSPPLARYCRHCGLRLIMATDGLLGAGALPHPEPLQPPTNAEPIVNAQDTYFTWGASGGAAPLLGTEPLEITVYNAGYDLADVTLKIEGLGRDAQPCMAIERTLEHWRRDESARLEIASWELPDRIDALRVTLVRAEFDAPA